MAILKNLLGGIFAANAGQTRNYALMRTMGIPIPLLLAVYYFRKYRRSRPKRGGTSPLPA